MILCTVAFLDCIHIECPRKWKEEHQIERSVHFILSGTGRNRRSIQCFRFSFIQTTRNIRQIVLFESRSSFYGMQAKCSFRSNAVHSGTKSVSTNFLKVDQR